MQRENFSWEGMKPQTDPLSEEEEQASTEGKPNLPDFTWDRKKGKPDLPKFHWVREDLMDELLKEQGNEDDKVLTQEKLTEYARLYADRYFMKKDGEQLNVSPHHQYDLERQLWPLLTKYFEDKGWEIKMEKAA